MSSRSNRSTLTVNPGHAMGVTTLAITPSEHNLKLLSTKQFSRLQEQEKVLLDPRFAYGPHEDIERIKALRREREKVKSMQILIRKQRERVMHKLIIQSSHGDEKFMMKDINCDYEYDMLRKMRARADRERAHEAASRIQRWFKALRSRRLFKFIVSVRS